MGKIANKAFNWYLKRRLRQIEHFVEHPHEVQLRWLETILERASGTEWGKRHGFSSIDNYQTFADRVPLNDYESLKNDISRMMRGERDILWPGVVSWFSKSSGTTNDKSKYIPVPKESLINCHFRGSWDTMTLMYNNRPESAIFNGKNLLMGGTFDDFKDNPNAKLGDVSALMLHHMPAVVRPFYSPDLETALHPNFELKIERMVNQLQNEDIRLIGGVPTWTIVLLRRMLEATGKNNILEVWPNLEAYVHGGVSFEPHRSQFEKLIPDPAFTYMEIYNASEGYFAVQSNLEDDGLLLLLDNGIYYEFLPMDQLEADHPKAIPLHEVKQGVTYALVITTNGGLWRYQPGDTVCFTSTSPYKIKITGRTQQFVNAFGEEVMLSNTDNAIAKTCEKFGAAVADYTVAPIYFTNTGKGGHQWLVEFDRYPANLKQFNAELDHNLQSINSDYEAKRFKSMALEELKIVPVPKGTFHKWLKSKGKYGGQHKVPRLANHRDYIEEILATID